MVWHASHVNAWLQAELAQQTELNEELTKQLVSQEQQHRKAVAHAVKEVAAQSASVQLTLTIVETNKVRCCALAAHAVDLLLSAVGAMLT